MTRLRPWLTVGAAALLAAPLTWLVASEYRARAAGTEVALTVEQVDPRSLLSGHYVRLDFMEQVPDDFDCATADLPSEGRSSDTPKGWVALKVNGDHHSFAGVGKSRAEAARHGPVQVRGRAFCDSRSERWVHLEIGLDRFHAAQKEAEALEKLVRGQSGQRVLALVSVGKDGRARLAGLRVDGRDVRLDWFGS